MKVLCNEKMCGQRKQCGGAIPHDPKVCKQCHIHPEQKCEPIEITAPSTTIGGRAVGQ